eukprot:tig00000114_g6034.t1
MITIVLQSSSGLLFLHLSEAIVCSLQLTAGHAAAMRGRAADAARMYAKVIELSKAFEFGESHYAAIGFMSLAGTMLEFGGSLDEAQNMLRNARGQFKDEEGFRSRKGIRLQYHALLAAILDRQGRSAEARQEADNAVDAILEHRYVRGIGRAAPADGLTNHCLVLLVRHYALLEHAQRSSPRIVAETAPVGAPVAGVVAPQQAKPASSDTEDAGAGTAGATEGGGPGPSVRSGWSALLADIDLIALRRDSAWSNVGSSRAPTSTVSPLAASMPAPAPASAPSALDLEARPAEAPLAKARPASAPAPSSAEQRPDARRPRAPLDAIRECVAVLETSAGGFPVVRPVLAWAKAAQGAARAASASLQLLRRFRLAGAAKQLRKAAEGAAAAGLTTYEALCWHELSVLSGDPRERAAAAERAGAARARMQPLATSSRSAR